MRERTMICLRAICILGWFAPAALGYLAAVEVAIDSFEVRLTELHHPSEFVSRNLKSKAKLKIKLSSMQL